MPRKAKGFGTVAEALRSVERSAARTRRARERHAAEIAARVPGEGYEPCIVSFIDVLGFRNLLDTRHAHDIRDVLLQLRAFTVPVEELPTRRMKDARLLSRAFANSVSDAVVRVRVFDDISSATGEPIFHVFGAIAHFERRLISEQTKDGVAAARARGKRPGRQPLDMKRSKPPSSLSRRKRRLQRALSRLGVAQPSIEKCDALASAGCLARFRSVRP